MMSVPPSKLTERILNRAARALVTRLRVPPRLLGYRHLDSRHPSGYDYLLIDPPAVSRTPLPCNVSDRDALPRNTGQWGFSFFDVAERIVSETYIATIPNCRVLTAHDQWGDPHYAIVTADDEVVQVRGTAFDRALHAGLIARSQPETYVEKATWILEQWDRNYAHWLQWHLTKIALLQKEGRAGNLILPPAFPLKSVIDGSLAAFGIDRTTSRTLSEAVLSVGELTVTGIDDYRRWLIEAVRDRLSMPHSGPPRKLFISRSRAIRRRLTNEDACWELLRQCGYERVWMEELDFDQQRALMADAVAVVSVHGAGLTNVMFAPAGLHLIEISNVTFPNAQFYALAGALGHHYWLIRGTPEGDRRAGDHDLTADYGELRDAVLRVEAALHDFM
jgi:capsular polysaccharide biosynthesis protein